MGVKTGLVLEGGAMRGMYTAGVLDAFLDYNINLDGVIGVSAGALFGVNYLSKQKGRVIRYNKRFNKDRHYMGLIPFVRERNIISTEFAYGRVPLELDPFDNDMYMQSNVPFYAVVTDVDTGHPEYIRITDVISQMNILRASGSLPIVSRTVRINGHQYLDGGISDSIPFQWFYQKGYQKQIIVLTRDVDYKKKPFPNIVAKLFLGKYKQIARKVMCRHEQYNKAIELLNQLEREGKVLIIRPSEPINIGKLEKDENKLQEVYNLGYNDCQKKIEKIRTYLLH